MTTAALIPARTGSKGILNKNYKPFCGKPLVCHTIEAAIESSIFSKVIVSSDGGTCDNRFGVIFDDKRPPEYATDEASLDPLLVYYSKKYPEVELWCLLQPTSPLRTAQDIKDAYALMQEKDENGNYKHESLVSVFKHPVLAWVKDAIGIPGETEMTQPIATYHYINRPNRQQRKDWFLENGAIYFTRKYILEWFKVRLHGSIVLFEMPYERSIEIDEPVDWFIAEQLWRYNNGMG